MALPLAVQVIFHPRSKQAEEVAGRIFGFLTDDASGPGLRIPTVFIEDDGTGLPPTPSIAIDADHTVVLLLADDLLAAEAYTKNKGGQTWGDYVAAFREKCGARPGGHFFAVQLTEHGWPIDSRLADTNFLRAWTLPDLEQQVAFICRRLADHLIRWLRAEVKNEESPLTIFLSHTKLDLDKEPRVVRRLLEVLTATQPEKTWYDSGDILAGSQFARQIELGVSDSALIAVVTDNYASRAWCRREVLLAKSHERPVVVVDAIQIKEARSFPYSGNVPVVRWRDNPQEIIDHLLREALRHEHAKLILEKHRQPGDEVLPTGPELVTLVRRKDATTILYPDPPLSDEELAVLSTTGLRITTPLQRFADRVNKRLNGPLIALSVSGAEDLPRRGLRMRHLDDLYFAVSRYLVLAGARLAYGGHLQQNGYTSRLVDVLRDPVLDQLRGSQASRDERPLVSYIAWPIPLSTADMARFAPIAEFVRGPRPKELNEAVDPRFMEEPISELPVDSALTRYAWARGLTEMRRRQNSLIDARVSIGGTIGRGNTSHWYRGRIPGVIEECLGTLSAKKPLYLIGAMGGASALVFDLLTGTPRPDFSWASQKEAPYSDGMRLMYKQHTLAWDDYGTIAKRLRKAGLRALANGLSEDDNYELATSRTPERIVELILKGLAKTASA